MVQSSSEDLGDGQSRVDGVFHAGHNTINKAADNEDRRNWANDDVGNAAADFVQRRSIKCDNPFLWITVDGRIPYDNYFRDRQVSGSGDHCKPSSVRVVFWRLRYKLSLRDLAEILLFRGLAFSHEAIRDWEARLAPLLTDALRQRRKGKAGRSWYVDKTYIKVAGQWQYLYRAIDRDGNLIDVYLNETRDQEAAEAFFRSAVTVTGTTPDKVTTDKHASYPPALDEEHVPAARRRAIPVQREQRIRCSLRDMLADA
jgi:transposase-like protein